MRIIPASLSVPIARGFALFLAVFTLINLAGALRSPGFDANYWWIDVGYLPRMASHTGLLVASLALIAFGVGWPRHWVVVMVIRMTAGVLAAAVFWNVFMFYAAWVFGRIHPGVPVPFSLLLSMVLSFIVWATFLPWKLGTIGGRVGLVLVFAASFVLFPLAQMYCFGKTDYRRKADVIVVFGARAYADGTPSQPLADRVATAVKLYKEGLAPLVIFSGGPGDGAVAEPESMKRYAMSLGLPESAILLDEAGLNTDRTVENTVAMFAERRMTHVLAVSHFYHLPRVKMTYTRALHEVKPAVTVYTVPAEETYPLTSMPFYMGREVAALWEYYLRPLWRGD